MKRSILILIIYLIINRCYADGLLKPMGGRSAAMGRTSVCEQGLWALSNNPAGLSHLKGWQCGLYYENQWMLKETAFKSGSVAKSFNKVGCLGLLVSQFGWSEHSENLLGLAYSRNFGPHLDMGLRADYWWLHLGEGYPDRFAPSFMLGVQSQITEKLQLGAILITPINNIRIGCAYRFTEEFVGQFEIEKDINIQGVRLGGGFEYTLFEQFLLRAGAEYNPNIICFGMGYTTKSLQVDVAAQMHQALGASIQIGIIGRFEQ